MKSGSRRRLRTLWFRWWEILKRPDRSRDITSWIVALSGKEVARIVNNYQPRIFARNIRGNLGDTSINRDIRITLRPRRTTSGTSITV